jgi:spore coat protein CotH
MKTKKELKEEYNQRNIPMGIFQIKNSSNNKVLIDNSIDMISKWNRHKMELKLGNHRNRNFQKDWNEYGEDHFVFEILSELNKSDGVNINYQKELKILEQLVIKELSILDKNRYL